MALPKPKPTTPPQSVEHKVVAGKYSRTEHRPTASKLRGQGFGRVKK